MKVFLEHYGAVLVTSITSMMLVTISGTLMIGFIHYLTKLMEVL